MSYLLDTDIISTFNKRTIPPELVVWLSKNENNSFISLVSIAEMRYGLETAPASHWDELSHRIETTERRFIESLIPLDVDVLVRWKELLSDLKRVNRTMTCEDSLLAATCLAKELVMATNNIRHFESARQFGLRVENPLT